MRKSKFFFAIVILILIWIPAQLYSCPVCYGNVDSAINDGLILSIFALLGITGLVLGGISMFFLHMRKRTRQMELSDYYVNDEGEIIYIPKPELKHPSLKK